MNGFPTREQVQKIKEQYPIGSIIRLSSMQDPHRPVPSGTLGEVTDIDDVGNLLMRWSNGQGLNLLPFEDKFEVVLKPEELLSRKHTIPNSQNDDFENKIVIVKAELLDESHRTPLNQLWIATNISDTIELQHINDETLLCTATPSDILGIANDAVVQMYVDEQEQNQTMTQEMGGISQ